MFKQKENLTPAMLILDELQSVGRSVKNDLNRYRNVTQDILKKLKKLSLGYSVLHDEYTKKSSLFDYITTKERIGFDYEMKMGQDLSYASINKITDCILEFVKISKEKIKTISDSIDETLKGL